MKFDVSFVSSFASVESLPKDDRPEIALIGRSNVGKSSLLNALAARKQLAKTSGTPGKTRTLNYFLVNDAFYLVDMPGYGYAKQSKTERIGWARLAERYFLERSPLRAIGLLIDSRHPELESDMMVLRWFQEHNLPVFVALTKSDKARQEEIAHHTRMIISAGILHVFATSAEKGKGIAQLRKFILESADASNSEESRVFLSSGG